MFNSVTGRIRREDRPPREALQHRARRRLGALFTLASALALSFAFMSAPLPAQAQSVIDGQWSVVHGGTGLITLNIDGSYTSTCEAYPNYPDARRPAPTGTFHYASGYVDFLGDDGSTHSYRVGGLVSSPDIIKSSFGSRTFSPLVMVQGQHFVCTVWSGTGTSFTRYGVNPLVEYDVAGNMLYATGSHDPLGPNNISNTINLYETAPNYFQGGSGCPPTTVDPAMHFDSVGDANIPAETGFWLPQAVVTIKDAAGATVAGATVNGVFSNGYGQSCVTVADGTCTVSDRSTVPDSTGYYNMSFRAIWLAKDGMLWDGQAVYIDVHKPQTTTPTPTPPPTLTPTPTPTPTPATHHIGDLDNATTAASSRRSWQPKVTATALDSDGKAVAGATVSGKFSHHKGTQTCVTAANGTCTLGNFSLSRSTRTTLFTVTSVTTASSTYAPTANTDPDGDSTGTTITVKRH